MILSSIVAVASNHVIGNDNDIPWRLSTDLKYFKKMTTGRHIIMGRNSFLSLGKPLPDRTNIIVTRDPYFIASNCIVVHSIPEAIDIALSRGESEAFITGGGMIYEQTMDIIDRLYITEVDAAPEGDVFFPEVDYKAWDLTWSEAHSKGERDDYDFIFKLYERK